MVAIVPIIIKIALSSVVFLVGCASSKVERISLGENRPAYSRAQGLNLRMDLMQMAERDITQLKQIADSYIGIPYVYGGETLEGIDCSAFTQQVFERAYSLYLPRRALWQSELGVHVFKYGLQKGDLVFFGPTPEDIDHVGIYMGDGQFINATTSGGVKYSSLDEYYWQKRYQFARRIIP